MDTTLSDGKTDPNAKFRPLICGINIFSAEFAPNYSSLGCFISVAGVAGAGGIQPGVYLLTARHSLIFDEDLDRKIVQPGCTSIPHTDIIGKYVRGRYDDLHDCAAVQLDPNIGWLNEIPAAPWRPGRRRLSQTPAVAQLNDIVYKFGASTGYTKGKVTSVNLTVPPTGDFPGITNGIEITGEDGGIWNGRGDTGSVLVRYSDDAVMGLNVGGNPQTVVGNDTYLKGYAFPIHSQLAYFGGGTIA